jgi:hypothetical protein
VPRSGDALGSWRPRDHRVCRLGRFETEWLSRPENLIAFADLPGRWIDKVHTRRPPRIIVLDMDSSESPAYGEQEGSAYNGHFGCTCYHPLFVFNQLGDVERCALRSGNVHSANGWSAVLEPVAAGQIADGTRGFYSLAISQTPETAPATKVTVTHLTP